MKVFLAGPYKGDQAMNVRAVLKAADRIVDAGHTPFVPHLYHFWDFVSPKPRETWIRLDLEWLAACEVLVRLSGESSGSDHEVGVAEGLDIQVFEGVDEFLAWCMVSPF